MAISDPRHTRYERRPFPAAGLGRWPVSTSACSLAVPLPPGFHVLAAQDDDVLDRLELDELGSAWLDSVRASSTAAGALLCAVHAERWEGELVQASLVVTARAYDDDPGLLLAAIRLSALDSTSTSGQVSQLELPLGPAVATADVVVVGPGRSLTGLVEVQALSETTGSVVQLTLCTPAPSLLTAYAAMTVDIAAHLSLRTGESA